MDFEEFYKKLFELQDLQYKNFSAKLLPTVDADTIIGIRTPVLSSFAKKYFRDKDTEIFLKCLPHKYFEENAIHSLIISNMKDYDACIQAVNKFLPHIDNWGTCDSLVPKIFSKHTDRLIAEIKRWISSNETYTIRFGVSMLMKFYLDENFDRQYLQMAADIKSGEYYVEMMTAWYFAEALVKQYDSAIIFLKNHLLAPTVHNRTIQKAVESRRISAERKEYLKSLRIKK